jgi:spermidine/putrescine transport system permease protein
MSMRTTSAGWLAVSPALIFTALFFVVPFIAMAWISVSAKDGLTLANYAQFFSNKSYWQALVNSLEITFLVTVISVLLAYPFAWILAYVVPERWPILGFWCWLRKVSSTTR